LHASPNIIWVMKTRLAGLVASMRWLVEKPEGKRPLGRYSRRWEVNIRMDLREIGWKGVDWIHLAQERDQWCAIVNTAINFRVPLKNEG